MTRIDVSAIKRWKIGRTASSQGHPSLVRLLSDPSDNTFAQLSALPQSTAVSDFRQQLEDLLSVYGERHGHGYSSQTTIHTPTWRERPVELLRLAAPYLDPNLEAPAVSRAQAQQERDERLETMVGACADKDAAAEFKSLLANGRHWWTVLEIHNHYIDQMTGGPIKRICSG